jgi:hypothetical protein
MVNLRCKGSYNVGNKQVLAVVMAHKLTLTIKK